VAVPSTQPGPGAGIIRRLDDLGRIVIPIDIRKRLGLAERDPVEISVNGDRIVLAKVAATCIFCAAGDDLERYRDQSVCRGCIDDLAAPRL
jgi:AbrB family transcriptional regulator, transcriptional pleiotropic regulator of transition state genes